VTSTPDILLLSEKLDQLIALVARAVPAAPVVPDFDAADAFVWQAAGQHNDGRFQPVKAVSRVDMALLAGIDHVRDLLLANTQRFANGLPANNALLWGARGMGKSSLVKAAQASVNAELAMAARPALKLVEIHREDIETLPALMAHVRASDFRFILFCDDLSFDHDDTSYKSLKAVLDGGIEGRPANVVFYATSNRRHLMPRDMIENERSSAINPNEATEEKVSLSDRFGLWLGFHKCSQDDYLAMVRGYVAHFGLQIDDATLVAESLEWSTTRGARSGRTAWQFVTDLAGRLGTNIG
jgi:predicted AAA+ superfamily ATPase